MVSVNLWGGDKNVLVANRSHIMVDSRATNLMGFEKRLLIVTKEKYKTYCVERNLVKQQLAEANWIVSAFLRLYLYLCLYFAMREVQNLLYGMESSKAISVCFCNPQHHVGLSGSEVCVLCVEVGSSQKAATWFDLPPVYWGVGGWTLTVRGMCPVVNLPSNAPVGMNVTNVPDCECPMEKQQTFL